MAEKLLLSRNTVGRAIRKLLTLHLLRRKIVGRTHYYFHNGGNICSTQEWLSSDADRLSGGMGTGTIKALGSVPNVPPTEDLLLNKTLTAENRIPKKNFEELRMQLWGAGSGSEDEDLPGGINPTSNSRAGRST